MKKFLCQGSDCNRQEENISERNSLNFKHNGYSIKVRRTLHYFKGCFIGVNSVKLSLQQLTELSNNLTQLNGNFPSEFSHQPRSLTELERW